MRLTACTLFGAIAGMLEGGLIVEVEPGEGHERRRCYRITRLGRALARQEAERLARSAEWAREKRLLPGASKGR